MNQLNQNSNMSGVNDLKLAVVVPAYNEESYLSRAIKALNNQTYPRQMYVVIVVDNASTDGTADVIQEGGARLVSEPTKGIPNAMRAGFDEAIRLGVDWVVGTDADSEVAPNWLETVARHIGQPGVVGLSGLIDFYDTNWLLNRLMAWMYHLSMVVSARVGFVQFTGSNYAVSLKAYQQVGGIDLRYRISADVELSKRVHRVGKVLYEPKMRVSVSPRRFKRQPIRALWQYISSSVSVALGRVPTFELDDLR